MKKNKSSTIQSKDPIKESFLIADPSCRRPNRSVQLLRIVFTETETKFDFGYQAKDYYVNGGWIKISPETFIRFKGSSKKLILNNATNIPYGPEKLHFNSSIEWRYFSLHFPSLLKQIQYNITSKDSAFSSNLIFELDLIENENGTSDDFNFYGIRLDESEKQFLLF